MNHIQDTIQNGSLKPINEYHDENTIGGYLKRHFIDTPPIKRVFPDHPLLPEPHAQSRQQIRNNMKAIQQKLEKGEIDGIEALVKTMSMVDDYFNTLDAEEVKYLGSLNLEGSYNDLHKDE